MLGTMFLILGIELLKVGKKKTENKQSCIYLFFHLSTRSAALATCRQLGGRLPTLTELFRNNQNGGTGMISNYYVQGSPLNNAPYLWTIIPGSVPNSYGQVRLSDGSIISVSQSSPSYFRCVWDLPPAYPFQATNCYGPSGSECQGTARWYNVDQFIRPSVPFNMAVQECIFNGGKIPSLREWQEMMSSGISLNGISTLWLEDYGNFPGPVLNIIQTSSSLLGERWIFPSTGPLGAMSNISANFICFGKDPAVPQFFNPSAPCNGGCFDAYVGRGVIQLDRQDRNATFWINATTDCHNLGGQLLDFAIATEFINRGVTFNSLWLSDVSINNIFSDVYAWLISGSGSYWLPSGTTLYQQPFSLTANYRCVWPSHVRTVGTPFLCTLGEVGIEDSNYNFACLQTTPGNAQGNANSGPFVDSFGYVWDTANRNAANYSQASATCTSLGGRLPVATEVFRSSRGYSPLTVVLFPSVFSSQDYPLWTLLPTETVGMRVTISIKGATFSYSETTPNEFRCVWPPTPIADPSLGMGNVFSGHKCFGQPSNNNSNLCFSVGNLVVDSFDRPPLPYVSAEAECAFLGGRLPTFEEFVHFVTNGAPNGYNNLAFGSNEHQTDYGLWLINAGYNSNSFLVARWFGVSPQWPLIYGDVYTSPSSTVYYSSPTALNGFRCVWNDKL